MDCASRCGGGVFLNPDFIVLLKRCKYSESSIGLTDYKFYCINGNPEFLYVSQGLENHDTARISFLTMDWQFALFKRTDYRSLEELPRKPKRFEEMKTLARMLSKGYSFLRTDFYEINGKIYFGELTFFPCSGMMNFEPMEWDRKIGDMVVLP